MPTACTFRSVWPSFAPSCAHSVYIPLRLAADSVAVRDGRLANETPLSLALLPAAGTQAMAESNRAVSIALEALNPLRVERFSAQVDMADEKVYMVMELCQGGELFDRIAECGSTECGLNCSV